MGVLSVASGKSLWRGYEYYLQKKVLSYRKISESVYEGEVSGSEGRVYHVHLDLEHPRKTTTCDCPLAKGKKIVCKHTVALFFTIFPEEAKAYYKEVQEYEEAEAQRQQNLEIELDKYINGLTKAELKNALYEVLYDSPEWVWDRFIRDHIGW